MKLATLKAGGRDGTLVVVRRDLSQCLAVPQIAPTLQAALDDWERCAALLQAMSDALNAGTAQGARQRSAGLVLDRSVDVPGRLGFLCWPTRHD